ncbi:hypothetical protein RFI_35423, partial [Reticulomyxa filosa]
MEKHLDLLLSYIDELRKELEDYQTCQVFFFIGKIFQKKLRLEKKEQATQIRMLRKEMAKMDSHLSHLKAKKISNEEDNEKKEQILKTEKEESQSEERINSKRIKRIQKDDNNEKKENIFTSNFYPSSTFDLELFHS